LEVSLSPENMHMEDMNIADIDDMEGFEDDKISRSRSASISSTLGVMNMHYISRSFISF
jgi:hypothetical protein